MNATSKEFAADYENALIDYLNGEVEEVALHRAYELGRRAIAGEQSILGLISIHFKVVQRAEAQFEVEKTGQPSISRSEAFLAQVMALFEMMHRQTLDMNQSIGDSERRKSAILNSASDSIITFDLRGRIIDLNLAAERMFATQSGVKVVGHDLAELILPDAEHAAFRQMFASSLGDRTTIWRCRELIALRADGSEFPAEMTVTFIEVGASPFFTAYMHDLTERKGQEEANALAALLFANVQEGAVVTDRNGVIQATNPAFTAITGYAPDEMLGHNMRRLQSRFHGKAFYEEIWRSIGNTGSWQGEIRNRRKNGEIYLEKLTINAVYDANGRISNYVGTFADITRLQQAEQMEYLAHHDVLTGLPNRLQLIARLKHALESSKRNHSQGAVLFLDLDRFKAVNDRWGHPAGDELLQLVAQRLNGRLREMDTLARLGGDEFVIILEDVNGPTGAAAVASEIVRLLNLPFELSGSGEANIGCSVGISMFTAHGDQVEILLRRADAALYQAKKAGRNTYSIHSG